MFLSTLPSPTMTKVIKSNTMTLVILFSSANIRFELSIRYMISFSYHQFLIYVAG